MKIVSFKVAQALKKAGFDEICEYAYYAPENIEPKLTQMTKDWTMECMNNSDLEQYLQDINETGDDVTAPSYLHSWLWLWRNKKIEIEVFNDGVGLTSQIRIQGRPQFFNKDPEEVIIKSIDYLVENDLI